MQIADLPSFLTIVLGKKVASESRSTPHISIFHTLKQNEAFLQKRQTHSREKKQKYAPHTYF